MGRQNAAIVVFNRGRISPRSLARADMRVMGAVERVALSSEIQTNWMTGVHGNMGLRCGMGYIGATRNNAKARFLNFVYALSDQADIELTANYMRVWVNDSVITRPSVSSAITNGGFDSDVSGWTDADESGAVSQWVTGGYLGLTGSAGNSAIRTQQVTVSGADQNVEHGVRVKIYRGRAAIKIGSTSGGDDYVAQTTIGAGEFSFAFTPSGDFHITISSNTPYQTLVDSIATESSGAMEIATSWGESDLKNIRYDQSGDVIFVACKDKKQYKIERRGTRSWGIAEYFPEDGPFLPINTAQTTISSSGISGDVTLTASRAVFKPSNIGSLYRITSRGQSVSLDISADNTFTDPIRVTGVGASRSFVLTLSGTWVATVRLQRSIGDVGAWENVAGYSANTSVSYNDGLDNEIIYYRLGIQSSDYGSGAVTCALDYNLGSISGVVRISAYSSATSVTAHVLDSLGGTSATSDWEEGMWSDRRGYPSSVALDEGRLWWAGKDNWFGSVTDAFESFDDNVEGDSGPIVRSLGSGPVDTINWLLPLNRLVAGAETSEKVARSSSLDEPLSPTVFNIRSPSSRGSSPVSPVKVDSAGFFVRNNRLFELRYYAETLDYEAGDMTNLVPEIGGDGFVDIAVQRYPDTRIHCVKDDGTVAIFCFDRAENLRCWIDFETDGEVEDILVKPATSSSIEDSVYYTVKRVINGSTVRYREKWALESECVGGTQNKQADSFIAGTQSSSATITGLSHLEGEEVVVWANGKCYSQRVSGTQTRFTVSSGSITLPEAVTSYVVGLPYRARYKSVRLAYAVNGGTALLQKGRIDHIGLIARNMHNRGLRYGASFDLMYELPLVEGGKVIDEHYIWDSYDEATFEFEPEFDTDSRVCLEAQAPMPCELLGLVMTVDKNERV